MGAFRANRYNSLDGNYPNLELGQQNVHGQIQGELAGRLVRRLELVQENLRAINAIADDLMGRAQIAPQIVLLPAQRLELAALDDEVALLNDEGAALDDSDDSNDLLASFFEEERRLNDVAAGISPSIVLVSNEKVEAATLIKRVFRRHRAAVITKAHDLLFKVKLPAGEIGWEEVEFACSPGVSLVKDAVLREYYRDLRGLAGSMDEQLLRETLDLFSKPLSERKIVPIFLIELGSIYLNGIGRVAKSVTHTFFSTFRDVAVELLYVRILGTYVKIFNAISPYTIKI